MNNSWILISTFVATALLALAVAQLIYDWLFRYRLELRARLKELTGDEADETGVSLFKNLRGHPASIAAQRGLGERLANVFHQAGVKCTVSKLIAWCLGAGVALAAPALLHGPWWAAAAFTCGATVPLFVLHARRHFRSRALCRQLPEAFEMMSRAVRAGQTVPAALQIIAEDFDPPISEEFQQCYEQQELGVSREAALHLLAERTGVMELQIFVVALLVQARFGGDLAELLDNLAIMIRKRFKLADRVRALTGEGRMQATVLTVLPVSTFAGLILIAPDYIGTLLARPLLLAGTAVAQVVGLVWIRRIVNFEI
jgi:tight adherence protein B